MYSQRMVKTAVSPGVKLRCTSYIICDKYSVQGIYWVWVFVGLAGYPFKWRGAALLNGYI